MIIKKSHLLICFLLISVFSGKILSAQDDISSSGLSSDSLLINRDSILTVTDSIGLSTDSIALQTDSVAPAKSNTIDAPVLYNAQDSMVMTMDSRNMIFLYGDASIDYSGMNLTGAYIEVDADSSMMYSTFVVDSIENESGYPVFREGGMEYEMKKTRYNFKTKKMFITDVITQQGEGYITSGKTKKMDNNDLYMEDGKYTTCEEHDHPHFYLQLTKAKVQPGKRVIAGPSYLVVEDVPLPIAIPFGFFPFTKNYSSGILMPTYGDELTRGFSLQGGGYYFAFNDYVDLALTGEVFTKGSWGLDARSSYRKRYKFNGNLHASYRVTKMGENKLDPDYDIKKDFQVRWSHSQDPKANPFHNFSASVNFATATYSRNDIGSLYSGQSTENSKGSSVNYSFRPPNSPFSFTASGSITQETKNERISVSFPNITISMREIYPFQRKEVIGNPKWYENVRLSYSGIFSNSISAKEADIMHKNIIKDWKNGMKHEIPISASFNLFKNIALTARVNYTERWYTSAIDQRYNPSTNALAPADTTYGFYRIYNYSFSAGLNTKLYGMYKPWGIWGDWAKKTVIRHVITPGISFSGAPDFGNERYGYWKERTYINNSGEVETKYFSPFSHHIYNVPAMGKQGTMSFSLDNNLEMKIPVADTDSTRKVTLVDQFRVSSGYNFLRDSLNWDNISANLRLKFGRAYTLSLQGQFDVYRYNENGNRINKTRFESGKGLGRLISTATSFSYTFNNDTFKKLFSRNKTDETETSGEEDDPDRTEAKLEAESGENRTEQRTSLRQSPKRDDNEYDADGYFLSTIPWSLSFNYSLSVGYDRQNFDKVRCEYPYAISQSLGVNGNISPTKNWSLNFGTDFNFDTKKFTTMRCSITRQMHCWQMSANFIPVGPYQSYYFTIAVSSSLLQDLKYNQSSNYRDSKSWGR
ncbi:MAG: LPS-assembly protein LptD [Dysgonamonadaceae bacterium]|jgi:hypothetical protein|nr:LPS-assembly protein LptD [Dysgonamonadaceae bacterium]